MTQASDALTNNPVMGGKKLIRPSHGWVAINFTAVWQRRGLLYFLTWRDIKVRYKQTFLGIAWVLLQPFLMMVVFSIFFGMLVKVPSDGIPYPVFTFCALVPWQLVANAFTDAGNSLTVNQNLLTKVYFPRIIIPLAAVFARLIDFACAFLILIGLMFYYDITPRAAILTLPVFVLFAISIGVGAGLWVAALSIKYRDVRHMIPFITQFCFFLSPIAYPASVVPTDWRFLYAINPMVGVIEGFRWALLGKGEVPGETLIVSFVAGVLLFVGGLCYFRQKEGTIADVL